MKLRQFSIQSLSSFWHQQSSLQLVGVRRSSGNDVSGRHFHRYSSSFFLGGHPPLYEPLSVNSLVSQCVSELVLSVGVWNFLHPPRVFLSPPFLVHNPIICPLLLCTFLPFPTPLPQTFSAYFQPLFVRFVRCPLFLRFCSVLFCLSPTVYVFHLSPLKCFFIINYGGVEVGLGCPPTATML